MCGERYWMDFVLLATLRPFLSLCMNNTRSSCMLVSCVVAVPVLSVSFTSVLSPACIPIGYLLTHHLLPLRFQASFVMDLLRGGPSKHPDAMVVQLRQTWDVPGTHWKCRALSSSPCFVASLLSPSGCPMPVGPGRGCPLSHT